MVVLEDDGYQFGMIDNTESLKKQFLDSSPKIFQQRLK